MAHYSGCDYGSRYDCDECLAIERHNQLIELLTITNQLLSSLLEKTKNRSEVKNKF